MSFGQRRHKVLYSIFLLYGCQRYKHKKDRYSKLFPSNHKQTSLHLDKKKYLEVFRRGEDERIHSLFIPHHAITITISTYVQGDTSSKTKMSFVSISDQENTFCKILRERTTYFFSWFIIVISLIRHHLLEAQIWEGWHLLTEMSGWSV